MTPTLPTDLISGKLLLEERLRSHLRELRSKTEFGPAISRFNLACAIISNIEIEIDSGRLSAPTPAVHSADGLLEALQQLYDRLHEYEKLKAENTNSLQSSELQYVIDGLCRSITGLSHELFLQANTRHQGPKDGQEGAG